MLRATLNKIEPVDKEVSKETQRLLDNLTKPQGSLGRLEDIVKQIASIQGVAKPVRLDKTLINMASDNGVAEEGVSAFPSEVTKQMVMNFVSGGAGLNVLSRQAGVELVLIDIGVASDFERPLPIHDRKIAYGTKNMCSGAAMTREEAIRAIEIGIEAVKEEITLGSTLIGIGEVGIGNTTTSSAIAATLTGRSVEEVVGMGTGLKTLDLKVDAIKRALEINRPDQGDPIDVLSKVGGFDIAGMAGVILGAAANRVPVVVDGFISCVSALIAVRLNPLVRDYLIPSHLSEEPGHKIVLDELGLKPMLLMNMRLGEGTGAVLGMMLVDSAINILNNMATFSDAGVSQN